jgi:hypothetical protein
LCRSVDNRLKSGGFVEQLCKLAVNVLGSLQQWDLISFFLVFSPVDDIYEEGEEMQTDESCFEPLNVLNLRDQIGQQITSAVLNGAFRPGE